MMKKIFVIACAGLASACVAEAPNDGIQMTAAAEANLSTELSGLVAGPPMGCVNEQMLQGPRSAGPGVLVFEGPGDIVYVNRTQGDCGDLRRYRSVRFVTTSTQLCRGDVAQTFDPYTGVQGDFCNLGDFVPYNRPG